MTPSVEQQLWMYEKMIEIREYEETMAHTSILKASYPHTFKKASPSTSVRAQCPVRCTWLTRTRAGGGGRVAAYDDDTVVGAHRPHHFAIAKGVPIKPMTAGMFGKRTHWARSR